MTFQRDERFSFFENNLPVRIIGGEKIGIEIAGPISSRLERVRDLDDFANSKRYEIVRWNQILVAEMTRVC